MKPQNTARLRATSHWKILGICAALACALLLALSACGGGAASSSEASASSDVAEASSSDATEASSSEATAVSSADATDAGLLSVTINVDSSDADGSADGSETVSLPEGANVLDAMEASSFDTVVQDSEWGAYIDAIGGIATGDYGNMSGWVYTVNEEMVTVSADEYALSDGDVIDWTYVTEMS